MSEGCTEEGLKKDGKWLNGSRGIIKYEIIRLGS